MREFYLDKLILGIKPFSMLHSYGVNGKISGNLAAVREMRNTVTVLCSPVGCGFHYKYSIRSRNGIFHELECLDLQNKDVIFGCEEKLVRLIRKIDMEQQPGLIVILPSVVTDTINEDLYGIASGLQPEIQAKIVVVQSQVFSHMDKSNTRKRLRERAQAQGNSRVSSSAQYPGCGYVEVMEALVEQVMEPCPVEPRSVNLETFIWGNGGLRTLRRMLALFARMGVKVRTCLPATDVDGIRHAPGASLNIVRRKRWALCMQEKFGTDFFHVADLGDWHGLEAIREFYVQVGDELGLTQEAESVIRAEEARIEARYEALSHEFASHSFALITGGLSALPETIKTYVQSYRIPLTKIFLVLNPAFRQENALDEGTWQKLHQRVAMALQNIGCKAEFYLNPDFETLQQAVQDCEFIICGSHARYARLHKPIIPLYLDRAVFDYDSFMEILEDMAQRVRRKSVPGAHLLLNSLEYDPVFYPREAEDIHSKNSREMFSRMWRLRKV